MDSNNWRQPSQTEQAPMDGAGGDWRSLLPLDTRYRIVNNIMDTLKRHLPSSGQEGDQELKKIAMRFEEKICHAATSQSDYLRRISLKMLTMESKSNPSGPMPNAMPSNSEDMSRNSQDPGSQSMQPQVQNQGQSLPIPMASNQPTVQGRPQLLTQNIQININHAGVQSSATALPSVNSLAKNNMPNVMQNSNMQNMSGNAQSSMGNSMVQGVASNIYNSQKQHMQGRQNMQQVGSQQQIQQLPSQQQFMYQQHQLLNQKLQQGGIQQPLSQPHMQQQTPQNNLLPSAQLQSSQQPVMQNSSVMQPSMVSSLQQIQPISIQQSFQSVHQQHQQSVLRQQQQQAPVYHQLMLQQAMLQSQQQQHLMGQQQIEQKACMLDIQQQQQPQRMLSQQNNLANMSGLQQSNQNLQQQQLMGQQSNLPSMHPQQLSSQTHVGTLPQQQQQMLCSQSGNSTMPTNQHPAHMLQKSKVMAQQQNPNGSALLSGGSQQQMMPQMQSQTQLQQQLGLQQQQPNTLQHNLQQRLQTPNPLLQQQNGIDPQKMFQPQRTPAEGPSYKLLEATKASHSTAQTGNSDAQEEVCQKTEQPPMDGAGGDWRSWLPPDSRQRIVNKIMDKLRLHLPSSGHEGVQVLEELAMEFEEYIYHEATVQSDYLRRIFFKMLTMESESNPPDPMPNAMPSNSADTSKNSQDPGSSHNPCL